MGIGNLFSRKPEEPQEEGWEVDTDSFASTPAPATPTHTPLTSAHVDSVRFHTAKPGYAFAQVEAFVDQVAQTLRVLEADRHHLREAYDDIAHLQDQVQDLQATIEVFRAKGDVLVNADGGYVTESQLADATALTAERDALADQVRSLTADLQAYADAYHALEQQHAAASSTVDDDATVADLTAQVHDLTEALAAAQQDSDTQIAALTAERDQALAAAAENATASPFAADTDRVAALETELNDLRDTLDTLTQEHDTLRQDSNTQIATLTAERDQALAAAAGKDADGDRVTALETELAELRDALDNATQQASHVTALETTAQAQAEEIAHLHTQLEDQRAMVDSLTAHLTQAQEDNDALAGALADAQQAAPVTPESATGDAEWVARVAQLETERDEALAAEAELRAYVDTVLAEWQASAAPEPAHEVEAATPAPVASEPVAAEPIETEPVTSDVSDPDLASEDDEWGDDVPTAGVYSPHGVTAPEAPNATITPRDQDTGGIPARQKAPLIDAPEIRGNN